MSLDATLSDIQTSDGTPEFDPPAPDHAPLLDSSVDTRDEEQGQVDIAATEAGPAPAPSDDATLSGLDSTTGELEFVSRVMEYGIELPEGLDDLSLTYKATHASASVTASLQKPDGGTVAITPSENGVCEILGLEDGKSALSLVRNRRRRRHSPSLHGNVGMPLKPIFGPRQVDVEPCGSG